MILLQILDEGSITDSQGRKVDFKVGVPGLIIYFRGLIPSYKEYHHLSD